jgi:hypothetical protein
VRLKTKCGNKVEEKQPTNFHFVQEYVHVCTVQFILTLTFTTEKDDLVRKIAGENPKTDAVDKSVDSRTSF